MDNPYPLILIVQYVPIAQVKKEENYWNLAFKREYHNRRKVFFFPKEATRQRHCKSHDLYVIFRRDGVKTKTPYPHLLVINQPSNITL